MFGRGSRRGGILDVGVTYLQMHHPAPPPPEPLAGVRVDRAIRSTASFYRYLYAAVGARWLWYERRRLSDEHLIEVIHDPRVEVQVLYVNGVPAGYAELDRRREGETEIAYFGLIPEFIGQGHGRFFIRWAVHRGWQPGTGRVWLHTCSLDHPRALRVYQSAGLVPYRRENVRIADPRQYYDDLG